MATLNIGCAFETFGDVKYDLFKTWHDRPTGVNVQGEATLLPFRDKTFTKVRASNVLEHLPNWREALEEWSRVTKDRLEIVVPYESDRLKQSFYLDLFSSLLNPKIVLWYLFHLKENRKEHLWQFKPADITTILEERGFQCSTQLQHRWLFAFLCYGRKARFFNFIRRFTVKAKYLISGDRL